MAEALRLIPDNDLAIMNSEAADLAIVDEHEQRLLRHINFVKKGPVVKLSGERFLNARRQTLGHQSSPMLRHSSPGWFTIVAAMQHYDRTWHPMQHLLHWMASNLTRGKDTDAIHDRVAKDTVLALMKHVFTLSSSL